MKKRPALWRTIGFILFGLPAHLLVGMGIGLRNWKDEAEEFLAQWKGKD